MSNVPPPPPPGPYEPPAPAPAQWSPAPPAPPAPPAAPVPSPPAPHGFPTAAVATPVAGGPSGAALATGVVVGPLVTMLAVFLVSHASEELSRRRAMFADADLGRLAELLVGALLLGAVAVAGRWAPTAPLVAGMLLAALGVAAQVSLDAYERLWDWWPTDTGRIGWIDLLSNGALIMVGVVLAAIGVGQLATKR